MQLIKCCVDLQAPSSLRPQGGEAGSEIKQPRGLAIPDLTTEQTALFAADTLEAFQALL